ncbi:hypothetical protein CBW65_08675 [Tumebacillus avium]|uniref:Proteinase inhibitor I42 chagasin domain-containing protein n=1 Tax=Tumebacillus avium TaxID=1903704 RepID=A0A1Y0IP56_9BACL|nr:protease inhibitor I42 family protein [Tumebacillus avium]ARU61114.1 hypothetical protein CBW65_08675 [Tumebacillus avium]
MANQVIVATEASNGMVYTLDVGDVVRIELEEGGFVGYYYRVNEEPDPAVINFTDEGATYTGSLAKRVFTAEAIAAGTTSVVLERSPDGLIYTLTFQVS